jgi:ribosomal protein S18 acetylase RimI-like enzyme
LGDAVVNERLCGAREVDELAVHADHRGGGIAARLLDASIGPGERAWLLTAPHADVALGFYRRLGWTELTAHVAAPDIVVLSSV